MSDPLIVPPVLDEHLLQAPETGATVSKTETAPSSVTQTTTDTTSTLTTAGPPGWLHQHIRNLILLAITGVVCYLALIGNTQAEAALVATFISLASYKFGETAALRIPGKDQ